MVQAKLKAKEFVTRGLLHLYTPDVGIQARSNRGGVSNRSRGGKQAGAAIAFRKASVVPCRQAAVLNQRAALIFQVLCFHVQSFLLVTRRRDNLSHLLTNMGRCILNRHGSGTAPARLPV